MKKQDWTPRENGVPLTEALKRSVGKEWWLFLDDYRQTKSPADFQDWLQIRLRDRSFRHLALQSVLAVVAIPQKRRDEIETPKGLAAYMMKMLQGQVQTWRRS